MSLRKSITRSLSVAFSVAAFACAPTLPAPELQAVAPDHGYNGEETQVVLLGRNFLPRVEMDSRGGSAVLDRAYELALENENGSFDLGSIELHSYRELSGWVPAGLELGLYDMVLRSPTGERARLEGAFQVTDTRADHLAFDIGTAAWDVHDQVGVRFDLLDPRNEQVFEPLGVRLSITSELGTEGLGIEANGLRNAEINLIKGGQEVIGNLDAGGHGFLKLLPTVQDNLLLSIEPTQTDSAIQGDSQVLTISPGSLFGVEITLPSKDFSVGAGDPFPISLQLMDRYGNPLDDVKAVLVLNERCGRTISTQNIVGAWSGEVSLTRASGMDGCDNNGVDVTGTTSGESEDIEVFSAEAVQFGVSVYPPVVTAGSGTLYALVQAEDLYGNIVEDYQGDISLSLTHAAGEPDGGLLSQDCPGFEKGQMLCSATPWKAGDPVQVEVLGEHGMEGTSNDFEVRFGPLDHLDVSLLSSAVAAGDAFSVGVAPRDLYGNTVDLSSTSPVFSFGATAGSVSCVSGVSPEPGEDWAFSCRVYTATEIEHLEFTLRVGETLARGDSPEFQVWNGPLARGELVFSTSSPYTAGTPFDLILSAWDTWGNPWLHKSDTVVDPLIQVSDETGTSSTNPSVVRIGEGAYQARFSVIITQASRVDRLHLAHAGSEFLVSSPFLVSEGPPDTLELEIDRPWVFSGSSRTLTLRVLDAWDNPINAFDHDVFLSTEEGTSPEQRVGDFIAGEATTTMSFTGRQLGEIVLATVSDPRLDAYVELNVLEDGCDDNGDGIADMEAFMTINASREGFSRVCISGGVGSATISLADSTGSPSGYYLRDSSGHELDSHLSSTTWSWSEPELVEVEGLIYDATACGSLVEGRVYVAEDDGEAVGPVTLSSSTAVLTVGSLLRGRATIEIEGVLDCSGDPASGATLYGLTTLGTLTEGLASTGHGLALELDASGSGSAVLSVFDELHGGTATLTIGRQDLLSSGSLELLVRGDDALPHVIDLVPFFDEAGRLMSVSIRFDEPVLSSRLSENLLVTDSLGALVLPAELALSDLDRLLEIAFVPPIEPARLPVTLLLTTGLRDLAGNMLDGDWDGVASEFEVQTGFSSAAAPDVLSCEVEPSLFRPDGDDIAGSEEADFVQFEVEASAPPAWWRLEVYSQGDTGGLIEDAAWVAWALGDGTVSADLEWGGRLMGGHLAPNGMYFWRVTTMNENLAEGSACEGIVTIDNHLAETL